ncbi:hypothetical protein NO1_1968, partial [Candidatus Termititenax aidoneus]
TAWATTELMNILLPAGTILAMSTSGWAGADTAFKNKWKVCDGTGGMPDLRGRFLRGGTSTDAATGGADSVTVGVPVPQHSHSITDPGHTHKLKYDYNRTGENGENSWFYRSTAEKTDGTDVLTKDKTGITKTDDEGTANASITVDIMPSYYTVIYIMKVA